MANVHTIDELRQFQAMPLSVKVAMTQTRIRAWVYEYGVDGVYVSFSGGKDSTVLLHLVRDLFPDVEAVFVDTGLEYPEIREFVKTFDNVTWLKPKLTFKQVIEQYGYPFISKEVSRDVAISRNFLSNPDKYKNKKPLPIQKEGDTYKPFGYLRIIGSKYLGQNSMFDRTRWKFLIDAPFDVNNKCCDVMKKIPCIYTEKKREKCR